MEAFTLGETKDQWQSFPTTTLPLEFVWIRHLSGIKFHFLRVRCRLPHLSMSVFTSAQKLLDSEPFSTCLFINHLLVQTSQSNSLGGKGEEVKKEESAR